METMDKAQAEIDALPDGMIGLFEMHEYGYTWEEMLTLTKETVMELFERDIPMYQLHEDGSETLIGGGEQITEYEGIFGIEKNDWENEREFRSMQEELVEGAPTKEAQLLYGGTDEYGIYQLKDNPKLRDFHFAGTAELLKRNLLSDDFKEIQPGNYNLVYTGELSDIQGQAQSEKLNAVYEKFNIDHPADYKGHSLFMSDIVVLHEDGKNSAHFVDSLGFTELSEFTRTLEGEKAQAADKAEKEIVFTDEEKQFLETDSAPLIAKEFLAWDEIESLGYRFFEDGYIDKFKPVEKALFGDGLVSDYTIIVGTQKELVEMNKKIRELGRENGELKKNIVARIPRFLVDIKGGSWYYLTRKRYLIFMLKVKGKRQQGKQLKNGYKAFKNW
ncbi:MAG: hypothetical protein HFH68_13145 [Lachnospiraceae bacterium]|nr:hypothetical protein [Lachnospiraceae bacterium]